MLKQVMTKIAILLLFCFVLSMTAASVSADSGGVSVSNSVDSGSGIVESENIITEQSDSIASTEESYVSHLGFASETGYSYDGTLLYRDIVLI